MASVCAQICAANCPWAVNVSRSSQFSLSFALCEKLFASWNRFYPRTNICAFFLAIKRLLSIQNPNIHNSDNISQPRKLSADITAGWRALFSIWCVNYYNWLIDWLIDGKIDCEINSRFKPCRILDFLKKKNINHLGFLPWFSSIGFHEN